MIEFRDVRKNYGGTAVLRGLNFRVEIGEFAVMVGPSGCGKTTTMKMINRLIEPDGGSVLIDGKDISALDKVALRRGIGYVIQQIGLFPNMTVEQNIGVVPQLLKYSKEKSRRIAREMLELVGMPYEQYAHKYPRQLSGGQQQRVGVLRALAASPSIVLMDEPFGALDPMARAVLQEEISRLHKKLNKTILFVTHDMNEALSIADKIIFMNQGEIIQIASPEEFLTNPANDLVRGFMEKSSAKTRAVPQSAADVMQTDFIFAPPDISPGEAVQLMARKNADIVVAQKDGRPCMGALSLKSLAGAEEGQGGIDRFMDTNAVVSINTAAEDCFEKLRRSKSGCVVVLGDNGMAAGVITESSMIKSLVDTVWGKSL